MKFIFGHYIFLGSVAMLCKIGEGASDSVFESLVNNPDKIFDAAELYIPTIYSENFKCKNHSLLYLKQLKELRLWATEMFDATTKFPSGLLYGSTYDFGNFDECLEVKVSYGHEDFRGKYCLARLTVHPVEFDEAESNIEWETDDYKQYFNISVAQKLRAYANSLSRAKRNDYHISYCLPSSCSHNDLKHALEKIIKTQRLGSFNIDVDINEEDCQTEESQYKFDIGDIIFGCVCGLYVLIVLAASVWYEIATHFNHNKGKLLKLVTSLSVSLNTKKLVTPGNRHADGLDSVAGMKVVSMFLIILGHRCMFTFGSPLKNPKFVEQMYLKAEASVLLHGTIVVDTFFLIAGFLATYLLLDKFGRSRSHMNIPLLYVHRLIRIIPSYAVVLAFYSTIFSKTGSGPLWQSRVGIEQQRCSSNWWTNLLFINNYVNADKMCMFQSWFLDCDLQYFLVTPFLVQLLLKKTRLGLATVVALIAASVIASFTIVYLNNYDAILLLYMRMLKDPVLSNTFQNIYIPSHMRATPYLLGILVGFAKYKIKTTGYKITQKIVYSGWIISVFVMLTTVYSGFVFYVTSGFNNGFFPAVYSAMHHLTWSLSIGWMIIALTEGHGGIVQPFLAWKPFIFLGRITFSAFLVHGAVQMYTVAIIRAPIYANVFNTVYDTLGDIFSAYVLGFFLNVFFESPIIQLEKFLLGRKPEAKPARDNNGNQNVIVLTC